MNNVIEKIKTAYNFIRKHHTTFLITALVLSIGVNEFQFTRNRWLSQRARAESLELRTELNIATETNTQLRTELKSSNDKLLKCTTIVGELKSSSEQSTTDIRQCISIVRTIRTKIQEMENLLLNRNSGEYNSNSSNNSNSNG